MSLSEAPVNIVLKQPHQFTYGVVPEELMNSVKWTVYRRSQGGTFGTTWSEWMDRTHQAGYLYRLTDGLFEVLRKDSSSSRKEEVMLEMSVDMGDVTHVATSRAMNVLVQ